MAAVVGVHGINQHLKGAAKLHTEWWPSFTDGVGLAGGDIAPEDLVCAFYGVLFRPAGRQRARDQTFTLEDVTDDEAELLQVLWAHAAEIDRGRVVPPGADVRGTPEVIQAGLRALSRSSFLTRVAESAFIGSLKQVRRYMREPDVRRKAQEAVSAVVTPHTKVLLGHSLGSVVAYEALHRFCDQDNWANVRTFVTLGSPLGIQNLIFDALEPPPAGELGVGPRVDAWVNISDNGDVVALNKQLAPLFSGPIVDIEIDNGAHVHDISPYLTACQTGAAIHAGMKLPYRVDPETGVPVVDGGGDA